MTTLVLGIIYLKVGEKESIMSQSMQDREVSPMGQELQSGTWQASSLVEIPTPWVRFPYPAWTLMMGSYNPLYEARGNCRNFLTRVKEKNHVMRIFCTNGEALLAM